MFHPNALALIVLISNLKKPLPPARVSTSVLGPLKAMLKLTRRASPFCLNETTSQFGPIASQGGFGKNSVERRNNFLSALLAHSAAQVNSHSRAYLPHLTQRLPPANECPPNHTTQRTPRQPSAPPQANQAQMSAGMLMRRARVIFHPL
jgi:hypothetical protein